MNNKDREFRGAEGEMDARPGVQSAILNAVPAHVAVLDGRGVILAVNEDWTRFASGNGIAGPNSFIGRNYLEVCDHAHGVCEEEARLLGAGIRSVLSRDQPDFSLEYPCHSPGLKQWFRLIVTPLDLSGRPGAVVMRLDVTDRRLAEESLRGSEARLRAIINSEPECVKIVSADGRLIEMNSAGLRMIDASEFSQVSGAMVRELIHPDDRAAYAELHDRAMKGETGMIEMRLLGLKGIERWTEMHSTPLRDEDGVIRSVLSITRDITSQRIDRNVMLQVARSVSMPIRERFIEQMTLRMVENLSATGGAISLLSQEKRHLVCTQSFIMNGAPVENVTYDSRGTPCEKVLLGTSRVFPRNLRELFPDDKMLTEFGLESYAGAPLFDQKGAVIGLVSVFYNQPIRNTELALSAVQIFAARATAEMERQKVYGALAASQQDQKQILESVREGIQRLDAYGRVIFLNAAGQQMLGWPEGEIIGRPSHPLIHHHRADGREYPEEESPVYQTLHDGRARQVEDEVFFRRDGSSFAVEYACSAVRDESGIIAGVVVSFRDVTERKQSEAKIRRLNRLYAVSSGINEAIFRVQDTASLYEQACRIAVEQGGLVMAWVGLSQPEGILRPVSRWGQDEGYLDEVTVHSTPDLPTGNGPAGVAFRSRQPAWCNDIEGDEQSFASRDQALARGYRSCAAFPLVVENASQGVFVVYSGQPGYFDREEINLLNALAKNLSFAIEAHAREQQRKQMEAALRKQATLLDSAQRMGRMGSWSMDFRTGQLAWSETTCELFGITLAEFPGTYESFWRFIFPEDRDVITAEHERALAEGGYMEAEYRILRPNGEIRWMYERGQVELDARGLPLRRLGMVMDITARKRGERLHDLENRILESISSAHRPLETILEQITRGTEELIPGSIGSILLVDGEEEHLLHGAAPGLPEEFNRLISGLAIGPAVGSCGTAVFRREPVIVRDIREDALWSDYRAEAEKHGLRACWSVPVKDSAGHIVAAFAIYHREPRAPLPEDLQLIDRLGHIVGIAIERDRTEMELRSSEERFRELAENIEEVFWLKDCQEGRMLYLSPSFEQVWGRPCAEIYSDPKAWLRFVLEEDRPRVQEAVPRQAVGKYNEEFRIQRPDGSIRWVSDRAFPIRDESGQVYRIAGVAQDITRRKHFEQRLEEQAALLNKANDAILVRDLNHVILFWSRGAERIYGWAAEEVLGRPVTEFLYRDSLRLEEAVAAVIANGEWSGELQQPTKAGRTVLIFGRWTLVRDERGAPKSILAINTDITERKRIEQQFLRAQRMEGIGTLAGGIAHDLNNVLAPILMSLELLRESASNEKDRELISVISTSAQRGAELVRQVLSFARGVEGRRVAVEPVRILREIQNIARDTFPRKITFILESRPNIWPLKGDPTQLHQVFMNLCVNARDAMPEGGELKISVENVVLDDLYIGVNAETRPGPHVLVTVADTGQGIPEKLREKIFEPFFTTKEVGQGTGLGLSTCQAIVKSHGGFIHLYSEVGKGSRFKVYLPAASVPGLPDSGPEEPSLPRGNGELVLVVDDEEAVRTVAKKTLERFGYRVVLAPNGAEAVSLYARQRDEIAVVLTDMAMPVMDGPATIVALRTLNPRVKIIGSSGLSSNGELVRMTGIGTNHFVPKPYTAETLLRALNEVLRKAPSDQ